MNQKLTKLKNALTKKFDVKICGTCSEFYGEKEDNSGLWVSGEESRDKNGMPLFTFDNGEMDKFLEKYGYYYDFYDGGTIMIYEN